MLAAILWSLAFAAAATTSTVLLGSRALTAGTIDLRRFIQIIFDWHFIIGAFFGLGARFLFILTNNAFLKIPHLAESATTITALINSAAIVFILIANYFILGERINTMQGVGVYLVLMGLFLISAR